MTERLLFAGRGGPSPTEGWESLQPGGVWLVWPASGAVVPCPPGEDIASIASESHPTGRLPCERCGSESLTYGAVVISAGAVLVGVLVCGGCAADLEVNHDPIIWVHPRKAI
jgi:hypothetical protein